MISPDALRRVFRSTGSASLTPEERDAVLDIAYLAIAADHRLDDDEVAAFQLIAQAVDERTGASRKGDPLTLVMERVGTELLRDEADAKLRAVAAKLTGPAAKRLAYKAAYALSIADLATSDEEFEFDLQLIDALGISQEEADTLTDEVMRDLSGTE